MYWLALFRNIPPVEYVSYNFEDPAQRARSANYLYWTDLPAIQSLNRLRGAVNDEVQDKARFAGLCEEHGLPFAPVLAEFRNGDEVSAWSKPFRAVASQALWVKPTHLQGSKGAECWNFTDGLYRSHTGAKLTVQQWNDHLRRKDCIVQPRLRNHPDIEFLTNGSLASLRIVTSLPRSGEALCLGAMLALPFGTLLTSSGGICCTISAEGVVSRVSHAGQELQDGLHPGNGHVLHKRKVPFWHESVALVLRAHSIAFPRFVSLGWDVALTPEGPLLLETNSGWGALLMQQLDGPLGETPFERIVADELREIRSAAR